jgi:hypothetical protein
MQKGSHINVFPETSEVYDALRASNEILAHGWDSNMYCTVLEWVELIQTMCACGSEIEVQGIDESERCEYARMRSQGIRKAQEAIEEGVSVRENLPSDFIAQMGTPRETAPTTKGFQGDDGFKEKKARRERDE